jgi:4-hydroxy-tetrahydrodipicolinate reductase
LKIALLGYGKMGKEIEKMANEKKHQIIMKIDTLDDWAITGNELKYADVAIEFSMPHVVINNIKSCFKVNVPVVVGTTGWYEQLEEIIDLCKENKQTLFYASNFSLGVNIFFEINRKLAKLMNKYHQYEILAEETHHIEKVDAPSGTAIKLANDIIEIHSGKSKWVNKPSVTPDELEIISVRHKNVPGTHIVKYGSEYDTLEIKHTAKNRKGFAEGALLAAEWVIGKKGVFQMKDMLT